MDFRQITQPSSSRPVQDSEAATAHREEKHSGARKKSGNLLQAFNLVMLVGIGLLIGSVALALTHNNNGVTKEARYVDPAKYQAVFLQTGQVYFGNITNLNNNFLRMSNIYYLTQSSDSKDSSYTLIKLGCQQIHDPLDEMVINRAQVTFWENLSNDGQVVTNIKKFKEQYPKGPDCSQVSSQTQASSTNTQGSTAKP